MGIQLALFLEAKRKFPLRSCATFRVAFSIQVFIYDESPPIPHNQALFWLAATRVGAQQELQVREILKGDRYAAYTDATGKEESVSERVGHDLTNLPANRYCDLELARKRSAFFESS
jgi:hypothetical protein